MKPVLIINGTDYAPYVEELTPTRNDVDADGSGRDVQTGEMLRTRVAVKQKWEVKMIRLYEDIHKQLMDDISGEYYQATILDPSTNTQATKTFYTSSVPYGAQRYERDSNKTFYDGTTFSMIER